MLITTDCLGLGSLGNLHSIVNTAMATTVHTNKECLYNGDNKVEKATKNSKIG